MRQNLPAEKLSSIKQEAILLKESRYLGWADKFPDMINGEYAFHFSEVRWS
jgi:hypothetical protein